MAAMEGYSNVGNAEGTNFDDMDLEGGNIIDEWHEGDSEYQKEDFSETENIRYLLKNCNVPLDNGKNGLVFSADYTLQGPRYTCLVCSAKMHGVKEFNMHANSQNHCSAMEKLKHPAKNFPILFEDSSLETQIELGEPAPPGMENEIQIKPCKIQAILDSFRSVPLIGLEYLIELTDGRDVKAYNCLLCDKQGISTNILKHLTSVKHSLNYLSIYFPRVYRAFGALPKSSEYRRGSSIVLTRIIKRIEGKFGRLKPRPYVYHHFASGKEDLLKSIEDEFHFRESPDDEFDQMIKADEILALQFGNIQQELKEKVEEEKQVPDPVVASDTKSSLFKTTKINVPKEKLRTERDESPECVIIEDTEDDSKKENDDRKLDNLSPVSGGSIGSMHRSRSRSNSRPRGTYRGDRSRSPDRYRYRSGNRSRSPNTRHRSRSRNRTRSPIRSRSPILSSRNRQRPRSRNRSRSGDRSRTFNRSRSGNRSKSPQQQSRPRFMRVYKSRSRSRSRDRLNLPYRHKRSYSRSRSRSPRSFNYGRKQYYRPQPRRSPDEEQVKSDKFKEELRVLLDKLKYHEKFPEKHPQYPIEWKEFWNRRYKELQADGKDPSKHDFKPEWISYWKKRMLELHDQEAVALKERIYNPVKEKPEESKDITVSDIKNTWKALTGSEILEPDMDANHLKLKNTSDRKNLLKGPPGTRMGFVPFTDDSSKVISVLRLITVLENMLGVLAPKVVTLLSKALSMEKVKSGSSEDILYNEDDCVLLEIVKEKLKGQFFAGLVERHLVNTTKYTIKNIEELLSKAPQSFGKRTDPLPITVKPSMKPSNPVVVPAPPPKQVTVPGIGTVDRMAIAEQIATALISQGRTDVSEQELESLIDAVVASTSEEQAPRPRPLPSTSQFQSQSSASQPSGALTLLQSAYDEEDADTDRGDPAILSKTLPLIESVDIITNLPDCDLRTLVDNFNRLQPLNQSKVINYLKAIEKTVPSRFKRLQETTRVNLNKLMSQASRISPFSSRRGNSNPGVVRIDDDDDDDDDYTFEDIYRAASQKVMKGSDQTKASQPPPAPYTNSAWWPPQ